MSNYDDSDDLDNVANSIIDQIKNQGKSLKKIEKEYPELTEEELMSFMIKKASQVIIDASDVVSEMKDGVATGTANDVLAFSELVKATVSAMEIFNKKTINDKKLKAQKEIKEMEIQSKLIENKEDNSTKLMLSQNEILKALLEKKDVPKKEETQTIDI
jgi:hypothetical protein